MTWEFALDDAWDLSIAQTMHVSLLISTLKGGMNFFGKGLLRFFHMLDTGVLTLSNVLGVNVHRCVWSCVMQGFFLLQALIQNSRK
jgi:hypothetical protein